MNKLLDLKNMFLAGDISKYDYMDEMDKFHSILFDYQGLINESIAEKIEISRDGVIVKLKDSGINLHCIKNDKGIIPLTILNFGMYEEILWDKTASLLKNPRTILDIGGNIGYFSLYFSKKFKETKFYTFEPIPSTFEYLKKNLEINESSKILAYNIGLSDKKSSSEMFYNPEGCGSSSLKDLLNASCTRKITCNFSTLDDFVEENSIDDIDFIKCDVEGAEKFVYEGGLKTIQSHRPIIYSEMLRKWSKLFNYHPNDIIDLFKKISYSCYAISQISLRKINEVDENTVETNFLFVPEEKNHSIISST